MKFTNEQLREIDQVRSRLEAYRDKIRSYPAYPEDDTRVEVETPEPEWTKRQWDIVNQLRLDNEHLRKQWYQHLKEDREYRAKKKTNRYNKYIS